MRAPASSQRLPMNGWRRTSKKLVLFLRLGSPASAHSTNENRSVWAGEGCCRADCRSARAGRGQSGARRVTPDTAAGLCGA
ncbi:Os10g0580001 [Oryza sativa Japonica Group]|uniref:Os10g0580001 protein n=1 Tax=Oryza sativa subsp. japonica TaxID=39947 RepID=A0A0P0XXN7_ORYSJ|nr:hypothetical protein EE612_053011 [Oryza sativa]BAT12246.1 Os10g0580001 [Oryza sativa Japonica Group]